MSANQSLCLAEDVHAPARARAWVTAQTPQLPADLAADVLLIVSELVTNAVRYGAPDIVLTLEQHDDRIRIEVLDGGEQLPVVTGAQPPAHRPTGRGLLIVAAMAADWGVAHVEGRRGKRVWAEVAPSTDG